MIIEQKIEIKTSNKNITYYNNLGYNVKSGETIFVSPKELPITSKTKIKVKCDVCYKIKEISYHSYLRNIENYNYYACSQKCANDKIIKTCLVKYGETHHSKTDEIKKKIKNTKKEIYGDENFINIDKIKKTNLEKYGNVFYMKTSDFKIKKKETMLLKYNTEVPLQNKTIKNKLENTNLEKYGYKYTLEADEIKKKIRNTKIKTYDDENYNNRIKYKETSIEKFGFDNPMKNNIIKEKVHNTIKERYGVEHHMHIEETFNKTLKSGLKIKKYKDTNLYYQGSYELDFLDKYYNILNIERGTKIKYTFNNKEHYYFPDFYIKEFNLIVEIKSSKWYNEHLEINLLKKQSCIDSGYKFLFIIDKDYNTFNKLIQYKLYSSNDVCYQYKIKTNIKEDITKEINLNNFEFKYIDSSDKIMCNRIKDFIIKYEWLGKLPNRPTHRFVALYNNTIGAVVILSTPNSFSKILGNDTKDIEKLISRGASASWTPKNIGSSLIMWSIKWMVNNTNFRLFSAYSDPEAKELGTIYQSCNFIYLGNNYGSEKLYFDLENPNIGWSTGRNLRKVSYYKKLCKNNNFYWEENWSSKYTMNWDNIPSDIKDYLINFSKEKLKTMIERKPLKKHKYIYILGKDKRETKKLLNMFKTLNPNLLNIEYPKLRGE